MNNKTMPTCYRGKNDSLVISRGYIGGGGEGQVYDTDQPDLVAKIFDWSSENDMKKRQESQKLKSQKLQYMLDHPPVQPYNQDNHLTFAWPIDLLWDMPKKNLKRNVLGYLMPKGDGKEIQCAFKPDKRKTSFPHFTWEHAFGVSRNFAIAMRNAHEKHYVIGDANEGNFLVTDRAYVTLIDTDSFQIVDPSSQFTHRCAKAMPEYVAPEIKNYSGWTTHSDNFALAVLIFELLMGGEHPYFQLSDTEVFPEDSFKAGHTYFNLKLGKKLKKFPKTRPSLDCLSPDLRNMFHRSFLGDAQNRPSAKEWCDILNDILENGKLKKKGCTNDRHVFLEAMGHCPWCQIVTRNAKDLYPILGSQPTQKSLPQIPIAAPGPVSTGRGTTVGTGVTATGTKTMGTGGQTTPTVRPAQAVKPTTTAIPKSAQSKAAAKSTVKPKMVWVAVAVVLSLGCLTGAWMVLSGLLKSPTSEVVTGDGNQDPSPPPVRPSPPPPPQPTVTPAIASWMKSKGLGIGDKDKNGKTLAHFAAAEGRVDVLETLFAHDRSCLTAEMNYTERSYGRPLGFNKDDGWAPMHFAAFAGQVEAMIWLNRHGANINTESMHWNNRGWLPIHCAALGGQIEAMKWLKNHGADINVQIDSGAGRGTPMHQAARGGHVEAMKWLKEQGADIHARSRGADTPVLFMAAWSGRVEAMKWLQEQGVDLKKTTCRPGHVTLVELAARSGSVEAMKWLKEQGFDINATSEGDLRPLHFAASAGQLDVMKWLKSQGVDIHATTVTPANHNITGGQTSMHYAAQSGHLEMLKWLKEQGADINAKDDYRRTPLDRAIDELGRWDEKLGQNPTVKWLQDNGARCEHTTMHYYVAKGRSLEVLKWLKEQGADINAKDDNGRTPLDHAINGFGIGGYTPDQKIMNWLKNNGARRGQDIVTSASQSSANRHADIAACQTVLKGACLHLHQWVFSKTAARGLQDGGMEQEAETKLLNASNAATEYLARLGQLKHYQADIVTAAFADHEATLPTAKAAIWSQIVREHYNSPPLNVRTLEFQFNTIKERALKAGGGSL
ncbi:MAG: ankyrin repeat domain-containing protein [Phycisphaerales bacterium]|nr:ankyrin repeat domain-containing protein [Phycisphaerales bacterium]